MAYYDLAVTRSANIAATLSCLRRFSTESMADLKAKVGSGLVVLSVSSDDYPLEAGPIEGPSGCHRRYWEAVSHLQSLGDTLQMSYRASPDCEREITNEQMIKNLMKSEIESRSQQWD